MRDGELDGMQHFDGEIEKLVRAGVDLDGRPALLYATNPGNLRVMMADVSLDDEPVASSQVEGLELGLISQ